MAFGDLFGKVILYYRDTQELQALQKPCEAKNKKQGRWERCRLFLVEWNTEHGDDTRGNYVWFVWVHKDELSWIIVPAAF